MAMNRSPLAHDEMLQPDLPALLREHGIEAVVISREADLESIQPDSLPHLALVDLTFMAEPELRPCVERCSQMNLPIIALVPEGRLPELDAASGIDDFVVSPLKADELLARAKLALRRAGPLDESNVIRIGDLAINPTRYEVSLKGRRINLRFKEYELLLLLATNPGRVYTREALLSSIWGYDYFGGTRTVDVHIRRLRSKIEDADTPLSRPSGNWATASRMWGAQPDPKPSQIVAPYRPTRLSVHQTVPFLPHLIC